jgi:hypothetical protein
LKAAGAEKLFRENISSVALRQQLEAAIEFAREGDTLVVTKIDRLARSVRHLCEIVDRLQAKGVALRILNMNLDTNDATGKLCFKSSARSPSLNEASCCRGSWKGSPKPRQKANIAAASPQPGPRLNGSSLWLTLARPEEKRHKR